MNVMGVDIPNRRASRTIRETDWRPEPIHSRDDIARKWIGRRHYQVSPAVIRVLWDTEREIDLIERQHAAKRNAQTTADADGDDAYIAELLLGDLRYLFLINCLLCNGMEGA